VSARRKLNAAYIGGSLLLASVAGIAASSWFIFTVVLVGLVISNLYLGEIRPVRARR
jgi:hypothetical protein